MNIDEDAYNSDGEVFLVLDEEDVIQEILVDEEELPERDDDMDSDADGEEADDSVHVFRGHSEEADDSVHVFRGHSDEHYTVACSPTDSALVATGGIDKRGFLWKIGSAYLFLELQGHRDSVSVLAFSFDGQFLASGSFDGLIKVWNTSSGTVQCTLEGSGAGVEWLKWHPKGHLILAGTEDSNVWMWNAAKNVYLNMFSGHARRVTCGDFTPDGKVICTGSEDASLRIWNPRTGESIHTVSEKDGISSIHSKAKG